jgi:type IV secretion system protein VirB11
MSHIKTNISPSLIHSIKPIISLLKDKNIHEVYCNSNDLYIWSNGLNGKRRTEIKFDYDKRETLLKFLADFNNTTINEDRPTVSGELPEELMRCRLQGHIPPICRNPRFNMRVPPRVIFSLDDYADQGAISNRRKVVVQKAIANYKNIIVAGSTGSGKTTLTNALIKHIGICSPNDRLVICEDTLELQPSVVDYEILRSNERIHLSDLIYQTLRITPDRILIGEVRDSSAYEVLQAWNTGHGGGVCTVHANSANDAFFRLRSLAEGKDGVTVSNLMIANAVDRILFIKKENGVRKISQFVEPLINDHDKDIVEFKNHFV